MMKFCNGCQTEKPRTEFYACKTKHDGLQSRCKVCRTTINKQWWATNTHKSRKYYENNKKASLARLVQWGVDNKEKMIEWRKEYYESYRYRKADLERSRRTTNRGAYNEKSARRRASKKSGTPSWADEQDIQMWYEVATVLSRGGVKYHVDHIVPLKSKIVCGLHAHTNMQVMAAYKNISKGNRLWPDMP